MWQICAVTAALPAGSQEIRTHRPLRKEEQALLQRQARGLEAVLAGPAINSDGHGTVTAVTSSKAIPPGRGGPMPSPPRMRCQCIL